MNLCYSYLHIPEMFYILLSVFKLHNSAFCVSMKS